MLTRPADLYHMNETEHYFTWSPDSKWIAFGWDPVLHRSEVLLLAADGSERVNLTESGYYDVMPKWIGDGDRILFFSKPRRASQLCHQRLNRAGCVHALHEPGSLGPPTTFPRPNSN